MRRESHESPGTAPLAGEDAAGNLAPRLIVGLGNPGAQYAHNRHNVGFWSVNRLARQAGAAFSQRSRTASVAEGTLAGQEIMLAKPRTFVNNSGQAVRELLKRYHLRPEQLLVIFDELDLPLGTLRIRDRGSHGGQNGMKSIISQIGSQDFPRIRIGIGRPWVNGQPTRDPEVIASYVLADPPAAERHELEESVARAADAVETIISDGIGTAMGRFNRA